MKNDNIFSRIFTRIIISPIQSIKEKLPKFKQFFCRGFFSGYRLVIVAAVVLVAVAVGIILICRGCSKAPDDTSAPAPDGTYYIDDYTAYEFDGKGEGAICLGGTTRYDFAYSVTDDKVSFDFEDDRINDITYSFTLNGDVLTITDASGANSYTMTKK